jgi:hypothetical protein
MTAKMPDMAHAIPREERDSDWNWKQRVFAGWQLLLYLSITAVTFYVIYKTVTHLLRPYLHSLDWTPVAAGEIFFVGLYGNGVLLAWKNKAGGWHRALMMAGIIAGSVILNIYGALAAVPDLVAHLMIVGAFFGLMLDGKSVIRRLRGGKGRPDRIGGGQWLTHPLRSAALAWWMQAWGETSREAAGKRYRALLYARTIAKADDRIGRVPVLWRWHLPETLRYEFSLGDLPVKADEYGWKETLRAHITEQLTLLPAVQPRGTDESSDGGTSQSTEGGSGRDSDDGSQGDTRRGSSGDTERDTWPETRDVDPAVLARMVRTAIGRYERANGDGRRVPDAKLEKLIKVKMSRATAKKLLTTAYAKGGDTEKAGLG